MLRPRFSIVYSVVVVAFGIPIILGDSDLHERPGFSYDWQISEPGVRTHLTRADIGTALGFSSTSENLPTEAIGSAPATRSSFMATWETMPGAKGYLVDVSTSSSFSTFVNGYHDLDVGNVTGRAVTGLDPSSTYYYRVRSYGVTGSTSYGETTMAATTAPTTGLTINATFDSSITNNPNAAAIQAMINRAVSIYESLFGDPITIQILFRYSNTAPDGGSLPPGVIARSDTSAYAVPWGTFVRALRADGKTGNDNFANATLPTNALSPDIHPASANGRALRLNTPPSMFANGTVGRGGPYDGIVTLNSNVAFHFTRPVTDSFDAQRATEHEMDEVMGFGSHASVSYLCPQDLFSWSSQGHRNIGGPDLRYFSIDGGSNNIVNFNQDPRGDLGDWETDGCSGFAPYVQNAFLCAAESSDIAATSPEGVNLDVIGYDLLNGSGFAIPDTSRRGMVFDHAGRNLYFSTSTGVIKTFQLSTGTFGTTYNLGGSLNGIDISRDGSFLLAAQNNVTGGQGTLQRVNLANGAITNIHYAREHSEGGGWDVAIASNGLAFTTTSLGFTPLRQIDLSTNAITIRTDAPGFNGEFSAPVTIRRSADGTRLFFMEGDISPASVFTYDAVTNTFGPSFNTNAYLDFASGAVNRNGNLIGLRIFMTPASLRRASDFSFVHGFNEIDGGVAFDAVRDIFYGVNSTTDEIIAYSTSTNAELFRLPITEDVGPEALAFGPGTLVASADGRWLALETSSGVLIFRVPNAPGPTPQAQLRNISTRASVQTGQNVMIGGFIVQGSGPRRVIIRAIGPELTQFGIPDAMANPRLELHDGSGALIGTNDNWQATIIGGVITSNQVSDIQNSGHVPTASSESAIIANLQPGNYTAIVSGVNNTTGVALVEVYDLTPGASSSLGNISTRSFVQTGQHVMIGGFIVQGTGPKRVIIRAIGPELTQFGIPDAMANPRLELHDGSGALIGTNDNWQTTIIGGVITSNQVSDIQNSGRAPTAASESAIIATLQPGNYTAIVSGVNNTTGVALVEVYDLE